MQEASQRLFRAKSNSIMTQFVGEEGSGFGKAYLMRCPVDLDLGMLDFFWIFFFGTALRNV